MKEKIFVSKCLMGYSCRYDNEDAYHQDIELLKKDYEIFYLCPEEEGGLTTPRLPSEIKGESVFFCDQTDVTKEFDKGAQLTLQAIKKKQIQKAVLKEKSPSCGVHLIYDGSFQGKTISGSGITTTLLKKHGISCYSEEEIQSLLKEDGL